MPVDLSLSALIDAGGGLLFVLVGAGILILGRGSRRTLLIGGFSVAFGLGSASENIFLIGARDMTPLWSTLVLYGAATAFALLLARELAAPLPRATKFRLGLACGAAMLAGHAFLVDGPARIPGAFGPATGSATVALLSIAVSIRVAMLAIIVVAAARLRALPAHAARERRAFGSLALSVGAWLVFNTGSNLGIFASFEPVGSAGIFLTAMIIVASILAFVPLARSHEPGLMRTYALLLVASGMVGVVLAVIFAQPGNETGANGIFRSIGVALLALAVIRYDLLGVPLPRVVVRKGAIATGALATLFIVAQLAQEFLSASYGLLTGGIVAGAFLFAAQPLQRAMERLSTGQAQGQAQAQGALARDAPSSAVEAYRASVRAAIADGVMTRDEEEHLADVAHHLALSPRDALRIRREVEREIADKGVR